MSLLEKLLIPADRLQVERIKKDIGEDDERFRANLVQFEKWVECQVFLPQNYERSLLKAYLRGCKHNMDEAKRKLIIHFICRSRMTDIFGNRDLKPKADKLEDVFVVPMPKMTPEGCRITVFGINNPRLDNFDVGFLTTYAWMLADLRVSREVINAGEIFIFDAKGVTPGHVTRLICNSTRNSIFVAQEAYAFRLKNLLVVNAPPYADKVVAFAKMFLKEKLKNRLFVDSGTSCLAEDIPKECLPVEYGGLLPPVVDIWKDWIKCLEEEQSWFDSQETVKIVGEIPDNLDYACGTDDFLSTHGTFRKLAID